MPVAVSPQLQMPLTEQRELLGAERSSQEAVAQAGTEGRRAIQRPVSARQAGDGAAYVTGLFLGTSANRIVLWPVCH